MDKTEKQTLAREIEQILGGATVQRGMYGPQLSTQERELFTGLTETAYRHEGADMRSISDYFERDSRRYDGGEAQWS